MCAPISLPHVATEQFEIKPQLVTMVQQNQLGGLASEDAGMHLHIFTELCNMTPIKDYESDTLKLRLFPFPYVEELNNGFWLCPAEPSHLGISHATCL